MTEDVPEVHADRRSGEAFAPFGPSTVNGSSVRCVITRMRMRRTRDVVSAYRGHRRLRRAVEARRPPGLLQAAFLLEGPRTCYSLSLWDGEPRFSAAVPEHIELVTSSFGTFVLAEGEGPEVWSTTWSLDAVSSNLRWSGFDLRALLLRQEASLAPLGKPA